MRVQPAGPLYTQLVHTLRMLFLLHSREVSQRRHWRSRSRVALRPSRGNTRMSRTTAEKNSEPAGSHSVDQVVQALGLCWTGSPPWSSHEEFIGRDSCRRIKMICGKIYSTRAYTVQGISSSALRTLYERHNMIMVS